MKRLLLFILSASTIQAVSTIQLGGYLPKKYTIKQSDSPKVSIAAGIHGDEFGGFLSAFYLYKTLRIDNGNIEFIPFFNIESIVVNFRYLPSGGDLNDKFAFSNHNLLSLSDRVYSKILYKQSEILNFNPDVVLSLHSGWGYSYIDNKRWGNSIVIDDKQYNGMKLHEKAAKVVERINSENPHKFNPYTLKIMQTFSNNIMMGMSDFSAWVLKNGIEMFTIESSKNLRIRTQIYNTSFVVLEFLSQYGINVANRNEVLSIDNIKDFLNNLKVKKVPFSIEIGGIQKNFSCAYNEKKVILVKDGSTIAIKNTQLDTMGYFVVPKSERNYKNSYSFKNSIEFKIKYFNIDTKKYDDYCHIEFLVD